MRRASRVSRALLCSNCDLRKVSHCTIKFGFRHHAQRLPDRARDLECAVERAVLSIKRSRSIADPLSQARVGDRRAGAVCRQRTCLRLNPKLVS